MTKAATPFFAVPIVLALLTFCVLMYVVMIYPEERAELLQNDAGLSIEIKNGNFVPNSITIEVGDTIVWKNYDNTQHKISGGQFSSGILEPGQTYSYTFEQTGVYEYSCEFHPGMEGTIIVK